MRSHFVLLTKPAIALSKRSAWPVGHDLYRAYSHVAPPMKETIVKTDIIITLSSGCYGRLAPHSGLAAKHFIDARAAVIEEMLVLWYLILAKKILK